MIDLALGADVPTIGYREAWELQKQVHADVVSGIRPDTLLLLQHPPVFTAGKRTEDSERPTDGTEVIDVDRGGKITWHGLGQLVGYPIVRLSEPIDVVAYVRRLESMLIDVVRQFGIDGVRVDGRSGVWVQRPFRADKVAAIGIRVSHGVAMHGFALNCDNALDAYAQFIPCGIRDAGVTTIAREAGRDITPADTARLVIERFDEVVLQRTDAAGAAHAPERAPALAGAVSA